MCLVVGAIHKSGVAHRDLKLENVMIEKTEDNSNGSKHKVFLIDFGLAHQLNGQSLLVTRCGSEEYAAPEIIKGHKYDGKKSDIWSLGIILYACLCGNLPFNPDSSSPKSLFDKICHCDIKFPSYLSIEAKSLILDLLTVEPEDRPDIEKILSHPFICN